MTDKEKIRAELERRKSLADKQKNNGYFFARSDAYAELLNFIDSLQEEPVSEELEEAADNALSNVLNTHEIVNIRSCLEMFRYGAKWQKEQLMKDTISAEFYSNEMLN